MCDNQPLLLPKPPGLQYSLEKRFLAGSSRKIAQKACDFCRQKKKKCDGAKPSCHHCTLLGEDCSYKRADKRRSTAWKTEIIALKRRNARLEKFLGNLKANNETEALQTLNRIRSDGYGPQDDDSILDSEPEDSTPAAESSFHSMSDTLLDSSRSPNSVPPPGQQQHQQQGQQQQPQPDLSQVDIECLPHEHWTRRAVAAFFTCAATLFYVTTRDASEEMINKIYYNRESVKKSDICEICAIAAIGSQYDSDQIPDDVKEIFFNFALLLLNDTVEEDGKKGMRAIICLSMFSVMSKSTSSRLLIASGLNLARWKTGLNLQSLDNSHSGMTEWRLLLRTLAFLECWLSFTMGYIFGLTAEEMNTISCVPISESSSMTVQTIQAQMSKIALTSAQIYTELQGIGSFSWTDTARFTHMLDGWYHELPKSLHLTALISPDNQLSVPETRSLLLVHVTYLGTRLLLYQHLLKVVKLQSQSSGALGTETASNEGFYVPQTVRQEYTGFAQQQARIISILYQNNAVFTKCWLVIRAAYTSVVLLLLGICQSLVTGEIDVDDCHFDTLITENLGHVSSCLEVLQYCSSRDIAADRFLQSLIPVHENMKQILSPEVQLPQFEDDAEQALSTRSIYFDSPLQSNPQSPSNRVSQVSAMIPQLLDLSSAPGRVVWT